ncbi:hypothetical protein ACX80H_14545 [Arthrobacter sp. MDT2-2]
MSTFLRTLPGLSALMLSLLSGYLWMFSHLMFTVVHAGSAALCATIPVAFMLIGRATRCRPDVLTFGAILLAVAGLPVLLSNGIFLFLFGSSEGASGDFGGFFLMLFGVIVLLFASLFYIVWLPVMGPAAPGTLDGKRGPTHH